MSKFVNIIEGVYRNNPVVDTVFPLVKMPKKGAKGLFVTVDASRVLSPTQTAIRVRIPSMDHIEFLDDEENLAPVKPTVAESKDEAIERIRKRFAILDQMTEAVAHRTVRGLIVSGPPGVGKSFGVEKVLDESAGTAVISDKPVPREAEIICGTMTPIALYKTLYENQDPGSVVVFDDCDTILWDEQCLNMLKAVLDSGEKRKVSWKAESRILKNEDIPDTFDFRGGIIFITNLNFEKVSSKKIAPHLEALVSRCHYIDLEMDSISDRFIRIEQIVADGMLNKYDFGHEANMEIVDFMVENQAKLREISLRMVTKIADLRQMAPGTWKDLTRSTCMKRS